MSLESDKGGADRLNLFGDAIGRGVHLYNCQPLYAAELEGEYSREICLDIVLRHSCDTDSLDRQDMSISS